MARLLRHPHRVDIVARSFCFIHGGWEPVYENNYRVCGECGHSFFTEQALVNDHNELMAEIAADPYDFSDDPFVDSLLPSNPPPIVDDAEKIYSCPHCGHDW